MNEKTVKMIVYLSAVLLAALLMAFVNKISVVDNRDPNQAEVAQSVKIDELRSKLIRNPNTLSLWNELGREYLLNQNFEKAYQAFNEARQVDFSALFGAQETVNDSIDRDKRIERLKWLTGIAESRVLAQRGAIDDESEKYLNLALALDPNHPKALWYAGLNSAQKNDYPAARLYWEKLEAQNPPGALGEVLQQRLTALDQLLSNDNGRQDATDWVLKVKLILQEELQKQANDPACIYLSLRQEGSQLPPVAAKKLPLPLQEHVVTLSSDDSISMMAEKPDRVDWDEPMLLSIIWAPVCALGEKNNIRFASLLNRANLAGVNEFILDPKLGLKQ